jgi:hypothetical protein
MPTTPRRARLWPKAKRTRVVRREPSTIQLRLETTSSTQPVTAGVKPSGSPRWPMGRCCFQGEVQLRTDSSKKLIRRCTSRLARHSRKTSYRSARRAHRRRRTGWFPASVFSKRVVILKTVRFVAESLLVGRVNIELARIDSQSMRDSEISGVADQQGALPGSQGRAYGGATETVLSEVTPSTLVRIVRSSQGWIIPRAAAPDMHRKEGGASSPRRARRYPRRRNHGTS